MRDDTGRRPHVFHEWHRECRSGRLGVPRARAGWQFDSGGTTMKRPGSDNGSGSGSGEFVRQIRQILLQAGFELVDDADERTPGLRVLDADFGARITWTASDGFTALAERDRQNALSADTSSADVNMLVRTAVRGLMSQRGHTVTETDQGSALLVLATPPPRDAATDQ